MKVFPQSCVPLASNLRLTGQCGENEKIQLVARKMASPSDWNELCHILSDAISTGDSDEIGWIYDSRSIFSSRLRDGNGRRITLDRCHPDRAFRLFQNETFWYKRLPAPGRRRIKKLVASKQGISTIKQIINTADGILLSLYLAHPEGFTSEGYKTTDAIISAVFMNCFQNYAKFQKDLKLLRKTVKFQHMSGQRISLPDHLNRAFGFMWPFLRFLNSMKEKNSKEAIFRLACFTQTRATGLADSRMCEQSINDFIREVTVQREFEPDPLMIQCIREVQDQVCNATELGQNPEFKISMSTSACFENPRRKDGKFGFVAHQVKDWGIKIPPLEQGVPGTLGNWAYAQAKWRYRCRNEKTRVLDVNVAAIRENGKARVVTSGSFWKESALQPYSHLSIHTIKTLKIVRNGLRAAKLGWKVIQNIHYLEPDSEFIFDFKRKPVMCSSDLEKATDRPTHAMARMVVLPIFERMGVPPEDLKMIEFYWLGHKKLYVKGKLAGVLVNGIPMGDPITKTCLSLSHAIAYIYAVHSTNEYGRFEGNGDDLTGIATKKEFFEAMLRAYQMLGYAASELDTFVHEVWGTYCEEWFHRPLHKSNTVRTAMKMGELDLLPYLDVPKIRTMIATAKDREDFSSDITGKVTLVGKDHEYTRKLKKSPYRAINSFTSSVQDAILDTVNSRLPLHLPRQVYGVGKAAPGWDPETWLSLIKHGPLWKREVYYHTLIAINHGRSDLLPKGYLKESKHFRNEAWVETIRIRDDHPIKDHVVVPVDELRSYPGNSLTKLCKMGFLIDENQLMKYFLFQERLNQLEDVNEFDIFEKVLDQVDHVDHGDFSDEDLLREIRNFCCRYAERPFDLRRETEVPLYDHSVIEALEAGNPLRVTDVDIPFLSRFRKRLAPKTVYEEEAEELNEWFQGARMQVRSGQAPDNPPPHLLEDDPLIIRQIALMETSHYLVVTDDCAMLRKAERQVPGVVIIRISCDDLFRMTPDDYSNIEEVYDQMLPMYDCTSEDMTFLVDTGSVEAYTESRTTQAGYTRRVAGIPWNRDTKRANFKINFEGRAQMSFNQSLMRPIQLGYPEKGFSYRRGRTR